MSSLCRPVAANNAADISWNLTGSGFDLLAVYVFGGSNGANLYKVADAAQMLVGSATVQLRSQAVQENTRRFPTSYFWGHPAVQQYRKVAVR
jgi:hypothetical protein